MNKGPEAGWYPNPEVANEIRWWDGEQWTAHTERNPMAVPDTPPPPAGPANQVGPGVEPLVAAPARTPYSLRHASPATRPMSEWLRESMSLIGSRIGHLFTLAVVLGLLPNLVYAAALYQVFRGVSITIPVDGSVIVTEGISSLGLLMAGLALALALLLGFVLWIAICRQVQLARVGRPEVWSDSLMPSFKRMFRVVGVHFGFWLGALVLTAAVVVMAIVIHPATLLLTLPALLVGFVFLGVRLSLAVAAASLAPKGVASFPSSFRLTEGRFGMLLGRIAVLGALFIGGSGVISVASQMVTAIFQLGGTTEPFLYDSTIEQTIGWESIFGSNPAGFFLSMILTGLGNSLLLGLILAGLVVLYHDLGGEVADDLKDPDL